MKKKKILEYFKLKILVNKLINRNDGILTDETVEINDEYMNIFSLSEHSQVNFTFTSASPIGINILKDYVTLKGINVIDKSIQINTQENENIFLAHGGRRLSEDVLEISIADFIAGMTDRFALALYQQLFLPQPWRPQ